MADPASLNMALNFTGMDNDEATVVFNNLPPGCTATVAVSKPASGSKRFAISADGLSVQGAKDVATALFLHVEQVADAGRVPQQAGGDERG